MDETKEILINQFNKLPKDVQDAILSVDLRSKMQFITRRNNLRIDQAQILENEAVFVMLGLEHPANLVANIAKDIEVSDEKALAIAEDLNNEIFSKIRESLKKIFEERDREAESNLLGQKKEEGGSLLVGSLSADEAGLLGKKDGEEEKLNREDILRDIEDKEHHNLPMTQRPELHLEARPPSEIVERTSNLPREQKIFERVNRNAEQGDITANKINIRTETAQKQPAAPQEEAIRTMPGDTFKIKMSGTVSLPKETVEVNDLLPKLNKKTSPDTGEKFDLYREKAE